MVLVELLEIVELEPVPFAVVVECQDCREEVATVEAPTSSEIASIEQAWIQQEL